MDYRLGLDSYKNYKNVIKKSNLFKLKNISSVESYLEKYFRKKEMTVLAKYFFKIFKIFSFLIITFFMLSR